MSARRVLVAGIGNVFFGDDAFGVEVVRRLRSRPQPAGVRVVDFGIRGLDLAYALIESCDAAILVDAVPRGGRPGTLYVLEPEIFADAAAALPDLHSLEPATIVRLARTLGGELPILRIVGCEPDDPAGDDMAMGLSAPVAAALDEAVLVVEAVLADLCEGWHHA